MDHPILIACPVLMVIIYRKIYVFNVIHNVLHAVYRR